MQAVWTITRFLSLKYFDLETGGTRREVKREKIKAVLEEVKREK